MSNPHDSEEDIITSDALNPTEPDRSPEEDNMDEHPVHTHQRDEGDEFFERVSSPDDFTDVVASEVNDAS